MIYLLLISLYVLGRAEKEFSLDSASADGVSDGEWNGLIVLVNSDENDEPEIVLSTDIDGYQAVYCLTLEEMFEADNYGTDYADQDTYGDHDEVSNTEVDFQNDVTWSYTKHDDGKGFDLNGVLTTPDDTSDTSYVDNIDFSFAVSEDPNPSDTSVTDYGLEYSFNLTNYNFKSETASLVLVFEIKDCSDEYESSEFENTYAPDRRRMGVTGDTDTDTTEPDTDTDTETDSESDDGISEDDSQELDIGEAKFLNHGVAWARCTNSTLDQIIPSSIIYGEKLSSNELHVVFDHWDWANCNLHSDPYYGIESEKYATPTEPSTGRAVQISVLFSFVIMVINAIL